MQADSIEPDPIGGVAGSQVGVVEVVAVVLEVVDCPIDDRVLGIVGQ